MRRHVVTFAACVAWGMSAAPAAAQARPPGSTDYRFEASTGLLVFHVHSDRTRDFEAVAARISQGLEAATSPVRREQAAGWRIFRATDTSADAVYVVVIDPVVRGADYDPVKMLTELAPDEVQGLYEQLKSSVIRVERLDLAPLPASFQPAASRPANIRTTD